MSESHEYEREFSEEQASLFRITLGPLTWAIHFVVAYGSSALYCARAPGAFVSILPLRIGLAGLTVVALAIIAWLGWRAWRQWEEEGDPDSHHELSEPDDRHGFLGHAAFLLAIVSFIGVSYTSLPAIFIETCR